MTPLSQYIPPRYSSHPRPLTPEENRAIDRQCITARYPDDGEESPHFALIEHGRATECLTTTSKDTGNG